MDKEVKALTGATMIFVEEIAEQCNVDKEVVLSRFVSELVDEMHRPFAVMVGNADYIMKVATDAIVRVKGGKQ
jgi:hypothetical protein